MIRKVFEVDPLLCPACGGQVFIISFIEDHKVIDKIIFHLKLTFMAERLPPPQAVQQELAAEDFAECFWPFLRLYSRIVKYCVLFLILCALTSEFSHNKYIQIVQRDKMSKKCFFQLGYDVHVISSFIGF